jgi:hypothetical protein
MRRAQVADTFFTFNQLELLGQAKKKSEGFTPRLAFSIYLLGGDHGVVQ